MLRTILIGVALVVVLQGSPAVLAGVVDFDNGDTLFTPVQRNSNPGPLYQTGGPTGDFMRVVHDGVNSNQNRIAFDRTHVGGASRIDATFDFRLQDLTPDPADGFGFILANTANWGTTGPGTDTSSIAERPNFAGSLGIGFDIYPPFGTNDVSIQFNGEQANVNPAGIDLDSGQFHRANVVVDNGNVSVTLTPDIHGTPGTPVAVFSNVAVPGLTPYESRVEFAGRTGGLNISADVDNVNVSFDGADNTVASFDHGFTAVQRDQGSVDNAPQVMGGGPSGNFLRLIHDGRNDNRNRIAFDQTAANGPADDAIFADFDFRMEDASGNPADGFGFILLPTAVHGPSGPGTDLSSNAERPNFNIGGVPHFGLGFDVYPGENDVNVQFNGEVINVDVDPGDLDLNSGDFHRAHLELIERGGGIYGTLVLTPDVHGTPGTPVTVFEDLLVPGMQWYDYRAEFAGRTGGLNVSVDLDNIDVRSTEIPEPATALLVLLSVGALGLRRRRSA